MKRRIFKKNLIWVLCSVCLLTGCDSVINLTTEEEDLIAEYAAGSVVRAYWEDANKFKSPVVAPEETTANVTRPTETKPTQKPAETETANNPGNNPGSNPGNNPQQTPSEIPGGTGGVSASGNIQEMLGMTGVDVTMLGYDVYDKYPQELYAFTVNAGAGKKLLVVEYDLWNSSDVPVTMSVNTEGVSIRAIINGDKSVGVYKTMLKNDIMNMDGTFFEGGHADTGALLFAVDEELASQITDVVIEVTSK